jgi:uncharacterized surface protein with fasciclin (FAS1) repeats
MAKLKGFLSVACLFVAAALAVSCQEKLEDSDQYKVPDWLKGNAYQMLSSEGNYSQFLQGINLTGYSALVDGRSILTVMAPDDNAFSSFLQKYGYSSVEDMHAKNPALLKKTIAFHLMYYAYDWDKLVNFRPNEGDGATDEQKATNAGLYYKHRTRSADDIEKLRVKFTKTAANDTLLSIYHYERFLPVLSSKLFETKGIDAAYNYQYFFPGSTWTGGNYGFNVANASVTDGKAAITDNGYLYRLNQVISPMETIYTILKTNPNYSDFLSLYDSYSTWEEADQETNKNLGYTAFIHRHGSLPSIACEWPVTDYKQMATLESRGYSIFAPTNQAMNNFFTRYWTPEGGYKQLSDLDPLITQYFIMQSFADATELVFPEEIKNGTVLTSYGTPINIDPDQVTDRVMCVNGVMYGMDDMKAPAIFSSVVGPAFKDTTYVDYLYALDGSNLILSLASNKSEFVALIPTNKQFTDNDPPFRLYTTTQGRSLQQYSADAGDFVNASRGTMLSLVNIHTASNVNQLPATGVQVIPTNSSFNYWFVRNGQITTNSLFNEQLTPGYTGTPYVDFHEITMDGQPWDNGRAYSYDAPQLFAESSGDGVAHLLAIGNDRNYEYYLFSQLLQKAGIASGATLTVAGDDIRNIVFVPTNEAIRQNIDKIPGCSALKIDESYNITGTVSTANKALLANYLRNYFVSSLMNTVASYPYPGSTCKGDFLTMTGATLSIIDNGSTLSVKLDSEAAKTVQVSTKYDSLPFAFSDGCMQLIDDILE